MHPDKETFLARLIYLMGLAHGSIEMLKLDLNPAIQPGIDIVAMKRLARCQYQKCWERLNEMRDEIELALDFGIVEETEHDVHLARYAEMWHRLDTIVKTSPCGVLVQEDHDSMKIFG